jgi:hypothetical protein
MAFSRPSDSPDGLERPSCILVAAMGRVANSAFKLSAARREFSFRGPQSRKPVYYTGRG